MRRFISGLKRFQLEKCALVLLLVAIFLTTLWRFAANQCYILAAVFSLFYVLKNHLLSWQWLKKPVLLSGIILFLWAAITCTYAKTPALFESLKGLTMYSKILFLLVLPFVISRNFKSRKWMENALMYGVALNVIISTLFYYNVPFIHRSLSAYMSMNATFMINPLQFIYMTVMAIWLLVMRLMRKEYDKIDVFLLIYLIVYVWFINIERSGYLLFISLALLCVFRKFGKRAFFGACLTLPFLLFFLYETSPNVKMRVNSGIDNIIAYQKIAESQDVGADNSLGLRLAMTKESVHIIAIHPVLGSGVGSFRYMYASFYPKQNAVFPAWDPHEAYVYVFLELGGIGLCLYLFWLLCIYRHFKVLPYEDKITAEGILLMFVIMGFVDSVPALNAVAMSCIAWLSLYLRPEKVC